jgi:hypothetical protein
MIGADVVPADPAPSSLLETLAAQGIPDRGLPAPEFPGDGRQMSGHAEGTHARASRDH